MWGLWESFGCNLRKKVNNIEFKDFCKRIYKCTGSRINRESAFVIRLLNSVNSTWSAGRSDDDDTAKKIFSGGTASRPAHFGTSITETIQSPFPRADCYDFFKTYLSERLAKSQLTTLVEDDAAVFDFDSFCIMCTNIFNDFAVHGEPLSKTFAQYYQESFTNPHGFGISNIEVGESEYILEAKNHCALCEKRNGPLTVNVRGVTIRNFRIAKIYPGEDNLTPELDREIRFYDPYASRETNERNLIALCPFHYDLYSRAPDLETFKKLKAAKREMLFIKEFNEKVNKLDFSKIEDIIVYLNENTATLEREDLTLAIKNVEEKIPQSDNYWLYKHVIDMVNSSFKEINSYMNAYELKRGGSTELGEKIKKLSSDLMSRGRGQAYVFNTLVDSLTSILPDDPDNKMYCSFIVAYFIAHCEVLTQNETAE